MPFLLCIFSLFFACGDDHSEALTPKVWIDADMKPYLGPYIPNEPQDCDESYFINVVFKHGVER